MDIDQQDSTAELLVRNVGGIEQTDVSFEPGVTVLSGRNATNRTSLLQAVMAALGSDDVSMKADADEGTVELELSGETYTRTLERRHGTVHLSGEPYLEDSTLADLFAFLLESNEARRAVVTETDLHDIIMRPVDTDEIEAEIERKLEERRRVSERLDGLEDLKRRLPGLEEQRTQLERQITEKQSQLEEIEATIESQDVDVEEGREEQAEVESRLEELRETRSTLDDVRYDLETEKESLELLCSDKRELDQEYEDLPETSTERLDDLETRTARLRDRKQEFESELAEVQSVISFNQGRLEEGPGTFEGMFDDETTEGSVVDELLPDQTVTCWTCGSEVETDQVATTIEKLQELSQELVGQITDVEDELEELTEQRRNRREKQRRREQLARRREKLETEIADSEARIETLSERRDELRNEVERIEAEVEALESDAYETILDLHRDANQLEYDLGRLETDLDRVEENIASIEERLGEEADLNARREALSEEITGLRTRIERIQERATEKFNHHMETVLELLEYENLSRIWLDARETTVQEGRRKVTRTVFDLNVVRQTESGRTYQDTVSHLSESEREVTGLVFALSGYLAHEVYETVPIVLLDSVEAIDSNRIAALVEYLQEHCEYLMVALLPEDAAALDDDYCYVTEI